MDLETVRRMVKRAHIINIDVDGTLCRGEAYTTEEMPFGRTSLGYDMVGKQAQRREIHNHLNSKTHQTGKRNYPLVEQQECQTQRHKP